MRHGAAVYHSSRPDRWGTVFAPNGATFRANPAHRLHGASRRLVGVRREDLVMRRFAFAIALLLVSVLAAPADRVSAQSMVPVPVPRPTDAQPSSPPRS